MRPADQNDQGELDARIRPWAIVKPAWPCVRACRSVLVGTCSVQYHGTKRSGSGNDAIAGKGRSEPVPFPPLAGSLGRNGKNKREKQAWLNHEGREMALPSTTRWESQTMSTTLQGLAPDHRLGCNTIVSSKARVCRATASRCRLEGN
jgi:hypothetical protein